MLRFLPYVLKTLWRHRTRTLLTLSGSAVALFVFSLVTSVQEGLHALSHNPESERTLIVFQANRFCPATSRLPEDYAGRIRELPGVAEAVPIKVFTNNCRASLDVVVFHGVPPEQLLLARTLTMVAGNFEEFSGRRDAALVGAAVAKRRGITAGESFSIGGIRVHVAGIYQSPTPSDEDFIYTHLEFLQRSRGMNSVGQVTQVEVALTPDANPDAVAKAIDDLYRGGPVATDSRPKGVFQARAVGDLVELIRFAGYLGYACVGLVLTLVTTTTVMSVQDRIREHGVLQTLGFSGQKIFGLVVQESALVSLAGGIVGVSVALVTLAVSRMSLGTEAVTIAFTPSISNFLTSTVVALLVGLVAGAIPGIQAARADIVTALRQ